MSVLQSARRQFKQHPWLMGAAALYLSLSVVELVRVIGFERPVRAAEGFYGWEQAPSADGTALRYRWMGESARLLEPMQAAVMTIPLYMSRPDMPGARVPVEISVGGQVVDSLVLSRNGWHELSYYLPAGLEPSRPSPGIAREGTAAGPPNRPAGRGQTSGWRELRPWHRRHGPPAWLGFDVRSTFVPAELLDSTDDRRLGIGVGAIEWGGEVPSEGIGFYPWEESADGTPFRWVRFRASQPLVAQGTRATFRLRADHPDIEQRPLTVEIYRDADLAETVTLADRDWLPVDLAIEGGAGTRAVLTVRTDRVWNPAAAGVSTDSRTLGVAFSEVEWR